MKKEIRDIVPKNSASGKSIRNIALPEKEAARLKKEGPIEIPIRKIWVPAGDETPQAGRKRVWLTAILALGILFFAATALFGKVSVTVVPKQVAATVSSTIQAVKNPGAGEIGYATISLSESESVFVAGSGSKQVSNKAGGQIVIYNNTAASQKLIASTRLQTQDGLIFRLNSAVSIPARTGSGSSTTPGSATVSIIADQPGAASNVGLTDFTVAAYKGDPKFDLIYGRSKTPITGGESGTVADVDPALLSQSATDLQSKISAELAQKIAKQIPLTFTVPQNAYSITFSTSTPDYSSTGATLSATGTVTAFAIDAASLYENTQSKKLADALGTDSIIVATSTLSASSFSETSSGLSMALSGNYTVRAALSADDLLHSIEDLSKGSALSALESMPGISSANISFSPPWKLKVPDNPDHIDLTIEQ